MGGTGNAHHKQRNTKVNAIERYNNKRRRERKKGDEWGGTKSHTSRFPPGVERQEKK
jgi:hypothetical protein